MTSLNTALHWWPRIEEAEGELEPVKLPRTEIVRFNFKESWCILDGEKPGTEEGFPIEEVREAADRIGYPVFIRSDAFSAKHRGPSGYRLDNGDEDAFFRVLHHTVQYNVEAMHYPSALMVRQYLDLEVDNCFRAFHGTIIGQERRLFAHNDQVWCSHYYWQPGDIEFFNSPEAPDEPGDWPEKLQTLRNAEVPDHLEKAATAAAQATNKKNGYDFSVPWSIDFAKTVDGDWYLIDMATAIQSAHPAQCPQKNAIEQYVGEKTALG